MRRARPTVNLGEPMLRNLAAFLVGAVVCMLGNALLLQGMMQLIPPPAGFDVNQLESFRLLEAKHLLSPFVAHAVPSLVGALVAALLAGSRRGRVGMSVGGLHLAGGIAAAFLVPAPWWFVVLDLSVAYLPMAYLGVALAERLRPSR